MRPITRHAIAVLTFCTVMAALAACSSSDTSGAGTTDPGYLKTTAAEVDTLLGTTGTYQSPPTTAPAHQLGKKIFLISCGQASDACSVPMAGAQKAIAALGWTSTLVDSQGDPAAESSGIRRAISEHADGIFMYYIDCSAVASALGEAKTAGIPVVAAEGVDCGADGSSPDLFTWAVTYAGDASYLDWVDQWSDAMVKYAIVHEKGKANILFVTDNEATGSKAIAASAKKVAAKCGGCSYDSLLVPFSAIGTSLQGQVQQRLLQHPSTNAVIPGYESILVGGVAAGVRASGLKGLLLSAAEGNTAATEVFTSGEASYGSGIPLEWEAYSGIDAFVRIFAGEKPVSSGIGVQLYDTTHNAPTSSYRAPFDFEKVYEDAWR
jgi:ribose transport system substrate-binding protein